VELPRRVQNDMARANPTWSLGSREHQDVVNPLTHGRGRRVEGLVAGEPSSCGVDAAKRITEARLI